MPEYSISQLGTFEECALRYLFRFCSEHQLEKKYLIVPSYQIGHQVGEALAQEGGSWVNLHFVTLPALAVESRIIHMAFFRNSGSAGDRDEEIAALDRRRWFWRDRGDVEA